MKLDLEMIKSVILGAVSVDEEDGFYLPCRFTKEQREYYKRTNEAYYLKTFATAGVKLEFETDSETLFIDIISGDAVSRAYMSCDVAVNGEVIGYIDNFSDVELSDWYVEQQFPSGEFSKEFSLGKGMKKVTIYLPTFTPVKIKEISLDDGASVIPVKYDKKVLALGDSITQGYDALRPSNRYMSRFSKKIGAEEINKGIGGEKFSPEFAELKDEFEPDYIIVAYGTNDWCVYDRETFIKNCTGFFDAISKNYPNSKIFALTPIWRKEYKDDTEFGAFMDVGKVVGEAIAPFDNVTLIDGFDFIPKEEKYFADYHLHPNDEGFAYYADSLYNAVKYML